MHGLMIYDNINDLLGYYYGLIKLGMDAHIPKRTIRDVLVGGKSSLNPGKSAQIYQKFKSQLNLWQIKDKSKINPRKYDKVIINQNIA